MAPTAKFDSGITDRQELALALLLLKSFYQIVPKASGREALGSRIVSVLEINCQVADRVLRLAESLGVKKEFMDMTFEAPVLKLVIEEQEEWDRSSPLYAALSSRTLKPKGSHGGRRVKKNPFSQNPKSKSKD